MLRGEVRVALPAEKAMALFTPVGERRWVPGWAPVFPAGEAGDGTAPGTVFLTGETIWVVAGREPLAARYARVTPGISAGTVAVSCRPDGEHARAEVTYELTALSDAGRAELEAFAGGYADYLAEWERLIAAIL